MRKPSSRSTDRRSGQAIIFLLVVLVIGLLVVLWNYDLHNIISTKVRVDNAGDAAALSAARWQGISLNMIGELNLIQAAHVCESLVDPYNTSDVARVQAEVEEIATLRARVALNGPLMGYVAAQSAAFMNLSEKDEKNRYDGFSDWLLKRATEFQTSGEYFEGVVKESYPGAWLEYGNLLASIADNKMVVDSANTEFYQYYGGSHILLDPEFYKAVGVAPYWKAWCYFIDGTPRNMIDGYEDFGDWPPLPAKVIRSSVNSEYFGLDLTDRSVYLRSYIRGIESTITNYYDHLEFDSALAEDAEDYVRNELSDNYGQNTALLPFVFVIRFPWHVYDMNKWLNAKWPTSETFPFEEGMQVRDEYNYRGADSSVDCYIGTDNFTPKISVDSTMIHWGASAKPFGYLEDPGNPDVRRPPPYFGVVLPAFRNARLIHNDLSTRVGGKQPPGSMEHFYEHLPVYMDGGPDAIKEFNCEYCLMLEKWENDDLRQTGSDWLEDNQDAIDAGICEPDTGSGGRAGGGYNGSPRGRG